MRIAFLGLGRMGRELATHILADGHHLVVWNRTASAAEALVGHGAEMAATPGQAVVGADVVVTVLFGPDAVREVVLDARLPFEPGAVWIDVTTVSPADAREFAGWAREAGVRYVHSPVIGSLAPARAKALGALLGGDADAVAMARPIVALWADPERVHVYDDPAKAAVGKLVANLGLAITMQGFVEALRLGHAGGLTTDEVIVSLDKTLLSAVKDAKGDNVRSGEFGETQFSANLLAKDAKLMIHTSERPLPAVTAAYGSLEDAQRAGRGDDDFSVISDPDR